MRQNAIQPDPTCHVDSAGPSARCHVLSGDIGSPGDSIPTTFVAAGLKVRWFQIGAQQLHLLQGGEPKQVSLRHPAFQVDDGQAARTNLRAKGLELEEDVLIPGADRFFVTDPDGNRIEIIEWRQAYSPILASEPG